MEARASIDGARSELQRIEREFETLLRALLKGTLPEERIKERSDQLEAQKKRAEDLLASAEEPPPVLHPSMAIIYRERVTALYEELQREEARPRAADIIRSLVSSIVLTPADGALKVDLQGDLAGILTIAAAGKQKTPLQAAAGLAVYPAGLISQVKVVAGACNQRYLRLSQSHLPR